MKAWLNGCCNTFHGNTTDNFMLWLQGTGYPWIFLLSRQSFSHWYSRAHLFQKVRLWTDLPSRVLECPAAQSTRQGLLPAHHELSTSWWLCMPDDCWKEWWAAWRLHFLRSLVSQPGGCIGLDQKRLCWCPEELCLSERAFHHEHVEHCEVKTNCNRHWHVTPLNVFFFALSQGWIWRKIWFQLFDHFRFKGF